MHKQSHTNSETNDVAVDKQGKSPLHVQTERLDDALEAAEVIIPMCVLSNSVFATRRSSITGVTSMLPMLMVAIRCTLPLAKDIYRS